MVEYIIGEEINSGNSSRLVAKTVAERLGAFVHDVQKIMDELNY